MIAQKKFMRVEEVYESTAPELDDYSMNFGDALWWFEGDKLDISSNLIGFSHPSYHEAFQHATSDTTSSGRRIKDILSRVILKLSDKEEAARDVSNAIAERAKATRPA